MKNKYRIVFEAIFLIVLGLVTIGFAIVSDLIRGRAFSIGWAQLLMMAGGTLLIIGAIFHLKGRLIGFLKGVFDLFRKIVFVDGPTKTQGKIIDALLITLFLLYGIFYFLGRWDGLNPVIMVDKNGDASALISYAVTLDHPENFVNDQSLNTLDGPVSYVGIFLPFIRFFGALLNNYGLGFLLLLPLIIFIQLTSFYLLGKELFHNRFWAFVAAVITAVPVYYLFWDFWGIVADPLPRFVFQSVTPLVLWGFLKFRNQWRIWPGLMLISAAMSFLHVISALALAFMLWAGFFLFLPSNWKLSRKIFFQVLNGLIFVIPFLLIVVLSNTSGGFTSATNEASYQAIMQYLDKNFYAFLHLNRSLPYFVNVMLDYGLLIVPTLALFTIYLLKSHRIFLTNLLLLWIVACLFISVVVPTLEHLVEKSLGIPPAQIDIVRNLQFTIPLVELLGIYGFVVIQNRLRQTVQLDWLRNVLIIGVYAGCVVWIVIFLMNVKRISPYEGNYARESLSCFKSARLFCPTEREKDESEVLRKISELTPIDSTFLTLPQDELSNEIRYAGMRSIAFTRVDKNRVVYGRFTDAQSIQELELEWDSNKEQMADIFAPWIIELSCKVKASHWLIDKDASDYLWASIPGATSIFDNGTFEIVQAPVCP